MLESYYKSSSQPFEKLKFYQNLCQIRRLVYQLTEKFSKPSWKLVAQMRDAARSAKQNIREGYCKDSALDFARFIKISRGSLNELEGDIDDCYEDHLVQQTDYAEIKDLIGKTKFQMDRYIDSLYKLNEQGLWKTRFNRQGSNH